MPKEHGSWSLALEPVALGLLIAPSVSGFWIAVSAFAGFLARRPLKLAVRERAGERRDAARRALGVLGLVAVLALWAAVQAGGHHWMLWLIPSAAAGAVFLWFDLNLKNGGREGPAEVAGATAFAGVTAMIAAAGGWTALAALGALFVMGARAVPTVIFVRAYVRGAKTGVHRPAPAVISAAAVTLAAIPLAAWRTIPPVTIVALALLFGRTAMYLVYPCPRLRPRTLGFQELALGCGYVASLAVAWHR